MTVASLGTQCGTVLVVTMGKWCLLFFTGKCSCTTCCVIINILVVLYCYIYTLNWSNQWNNNRYTTLPTIIPSWFPSANELIFHSLSGFTSKYVAVKVVLCNESQIYIIRLALLCFPECPFSFKDWFSQQKYRSVCRWIMSISRIHLQIVNQ